MKRSNPFIPSLVPASNPARVRTTVLVTLVGQAALLAVLLIQGCKPSVQSEATPSADVTSSAATTNTNTLALDPISTNAISPSTNVATTVSASNNNDLASSSNSIVPLLLPPLDTNSISTAKPGTYVVVSGDSFYKIAKANGILVRSLKAANPDVNPHRLKVGQVLNLPQGAEAEATASTASTATPTTTTDPSNPATEAAPPTATVTPVSTTIASAASGAGIIYIVKSGDTLFRIARTQHTTVKELRALNNLTTDKILLGQKLKVASSGDQS